MHSIWFGEFLGTAILILLGGGVCAGVNLRKSFAQGAGWMVVTTGWAMAVFCGVLTSKAFGSDGAHLNPAITIAAAVISGDWSQLGLYWSAQMLGAMFGATLVVLHYGPHWKGTDDPAAKLSVFSTSPAIPSTFFNLFGEIIGTAVLVIVAQAIGSRGVAAAGPAPALAPWLVGSVVWGIGLSLGGTTGYAINPARDLGPRLIHALLPIPGKGASNWRYAWVPVVGPLLGGALAGLLVHYAHI